MFNWKKNLSKMNGITIKHSDMQFQMKNEVTTLLAEIFQTEQITPIKISKILTESLNQKYPSGWICLIGKQFVASISHQPRKFIRMAHQNMNILVYKANSKQ